MGCIGPPHDFVLTPVEIFLYGIVSMCLVIFMASRRAHKTRLATAEVIQSLLEDYYLMKLYLVAKIICLEMMRCQNPNTLWCLIIKIPPSDDAVPAQPIPEE